MRGEERKGPVADSMLYIILSRRRDKGWKAHYTAAGECLLKVVSVICLLMTESCSMSKVFFTHAQNKDFKLSGTLA